jgi:hypothetical protein
MRYAPFERRDLEPRRPSRLLPEDRFSVTKSFGLDRKISKGLKKERLETLLWR